MTPGDEGEYRRLLASRPDAMIYHSLEFREFLLAAAGGEARYLVASRGTALDGSIPVFVREGSVTVANSLPWYGSHGGCLLAGASDEAARTSLLSRLRRMLDEELPKPAVLVVILTPAEERWREEYVRVLRPVATDGRIGQVSDLPAEPDPALLMSCFHSKTRNLVRKASKQGFEVSVRDDDFAWDSLYRIHEANMGAIGGKAKPRAHFDAMRAHIPAAWRSLYLALAGGEVAAALLVLRFQDVVEYLTPVVARDFRGRQPLSLLIFRAMSEALRAGARTWNWGGTWHTQESLHHFKAGWGAVDRPYSYLISVSGVDLPITRDFVTRASAAAPWYYVYPFHAS